MVAYERKEDGTITDEFASDIRALKCAGGTGPGPGGTGTLAAPVISASDGTFLDKVAITWPSVTGATSYEIFRNNADTVTTALSIGVVATNSFDDATADPGVTYFYWVKAVNATSTSAFSNSDSGYASVEIPAIDTLEATKGFSSENNTINTIRLVWTPPVGAQQYDIYRQSSVKLTVSANFLLATKIDGGRVPFDNSATINSGPSPLFLDNGGELVYFDNPPVDDDIYYYWVVSKGNSGTGMSQESNVADGWATGFGNGAASSGEITLSRNSPTTAVQTGAARAWLVLQGSGAGGAGADQLHGGGGGGAGAVIWGEFVIPAGPKPKLRVVYTPNQLDTGRANSQTDGADGTRMDLEFSPDDGVSWSNVMTALPPGGGKYDIAGGGLGGDGATGTKISGLLRSGIRDGHAGLAAIGKKGGRSGNVFGATRTPPTHYGTGNPPTYSDGLGRPAGGGSGALGPGLLFGGKGLSGSVLVFFQTF